MPQHQQPRGNDLLTCSQAGAHRITIVLQRAQLNRHLQREAALRWQPAQPRAINAAGVAIQVGPRSHDKNKALPSQTGDRSGGHRELLPCREHNLGPQTHAAAPAR